MDGGLKNLNYGIAGQWAKEFKVEIVEAPGL
jgi:hypothetical protein